MNVELIEVKDLNPETTPDQDLKNLFKQSLVIIKTWHNINTTVESEKIFRIYLEHAPEMQIYRDIKNKYKFNW